LNDVPSGATVVAAAAQTLTSRVEPE
jgi:hypothetical protein